MFVSDEVVNKVSEELIITRQKRREIQKLSTKDLTRYIVRIYRLGFEDGAESCEKAMQEKACEDEEVKADWDDVLRIIGEVKGIGQKRLADIDKKMREAF